MLLTAIIIVTLFKKKQKERKKIGKLATQQQKHQMLRMTDIE